ncbi:hypothetical protein [Schlesneria sp. T3-172]|uniref:hypothetical protein n=1 Tax=Schlesneria sphaerica TaxID=3373610 RepID=UPI0037C5A6DA
MNFPKFHLSGMGGLDGRLRSGIGVDVDWRTEEVGAETCDNFKAISLHQRGTSRVVPQPHITAITAQ